MSDTLKPEHVAALMKGDGISIFDKILKLERQRDELIPLVEMAIERFGELGYAATKATIKDRLQEIKEAKQ